MRTGITFRTVELALTNFCHLQCRGCGSFSPDSNKKSELDYRPLLTKLKLFDIEKIVLCGNSGEPLEHSAISDVLVELSKHFPASMIEVCTNGELLFDKISSETLGSIAKNVIFQIALDGPDQITHEITRVGGNFSQVIKVLHKLTDLEFPFEVVYSRHLENEQAAGQTAELVKKHFGKELLFRDTTIVTDKIRPPLNLSKNGNVSVLYKEEKRIATTEICPNKKSLYIHTTGECYPCVSFVKDTLSMRPPNIHDEESWIEFSKKFFSFRDNFCESYRAKGDIRQCELNCGVYHHFKYDSLSDLKAGYND